MGATGSFPTTVAVKCEDRTEVTTRNRQDSSEATQQHFPQRPLYREDHLLEENGDENSTSRSYSSKKERSLTDFTFKCAVGQLS